MKRNWTKSRQWFVIAASVVAACVVSAEPEPFDHDLIRFPLTGAHERVACESCHQGGRFPGTPVACAGCHDGSGLRANSAEPINHIPTITDCSDCHTTRRWTQVRMDHSTVSDVCASCHMGSMARGKSISHVQSSNQCEDCHRTNTWGGAVFSHGAVTGACSSCHNGVTATGKTPTHIVTNSDCEACHRTRGWLPATGFDHGGVTGACSTCHNGTTATGKTPTHIATTSDCDACHATRGWLPVTGFDHDAVTGSCSNCHNGVTATGTPSVHFFSSLDCNACHRTSGWSQVAYQHTGNYPGDHRKQLDCRDCHGGNSQTVTWSHPSYQPDCAGCHAGDYKERKHKKVSSNGTKYTVSELRDCAGACHVYTNATLTTISKRRNSKHRVSKGGF